LKITAVVQRCLSYRERKQGVPFSRHSAIGVFDPSDLNVMERVFHQACAEAGIPATGTAAENLAARVVLHHRSGITDEGKLLTAVQAATVPAG
jgi:hypothetical protein